MQCLPEILPKHGRYFRYSAAMRASRLLSILMLLQLRGRLTAESLAAEFEVSVRTIYRDVDALSASGVPVYVDRGRFGGIALHEGYHDIPIPSIAARATVTRIAGAPQIDMTLITVEGIMSKAFGAKGTMTFEPYLGGGAVWRHGECRGRIGFTERGDGGFGYDPVFVPDDGDGRTFAQMDASEKHVISHRGRAMVAAAALLREFLTDER